MTSQEHPVRILADAIETWPIDDLVPYVRNSKKHPPEQVAQIAASMREFGFTIPVLVAEDGTIIAGHGRVLAAQKIGLAEVPVIVARGWSDEQRRAYTIADNKLTEAGDWDEDLLRIELGELRDEGFDISFLGISAGEIAKILDELDDANDPEAEWQGMPEFDQKDKTAYRTLPVHFKDEEAVQRFAELIGQTITPKTRFVWYPEIEIERYADKRYAAE